jgi:hypothetical protein
MALTPNRTETFSVALDRQPDTWGQGLGAGSVTQSWYDIPYPKLSLLLQETKTFTDQVGHVIQITSDTWDYDEATRAPNSLLHEEWAYVWLPGVTSGYQLIKTQQERTVYFYTGWLIGGPMSHRKTMAAWVIYDLAPAGHALTSAQQAKAQAKGWSTVPSSYGSDTENRIVPGSGRLWTRAIREAATVEKDTAPQIALWRDPVQVEEETVTEDFQKIIKETWRKNFLQPGPPTVERTEELKDPLLVSFPVDLTAPTLALQGSTAAGLTFLVTGGDVDLKSLDGFARFVRRIRPEKYALYRRVISEPASTPTGDPYGTYATPPTYVAQGIGPITDTASVDYAGNPVDPLPSPISYTESEDPTPPTPQVWGLVCEAANLSNADPAGDSHAILTDSSVVTSGVYEYYAVAILAGSSSPESNHVTVTYQGTGSAGGIAVTVRQKPDGSLELEADGPPIPGLPAGYGETAVIEAHVAFDDPPAFGWQDGYEITDPQTFAREVGLRQFLRDGVRSTCSVALAVPLLNLEHGECVQIPLVLWETYGNGLHLSTQTVPTDYLLDGFGFTISRKGNDWTVDAGALELISP